MSELLIKGLSLTRPWPFAFTHGGKLVENRSWKPPKNMIGQFIALHAAKSWSEDDRMFINRVTGLEVPRKQSCTHSEIFAVGKLTGYVEHESQLPPEQVRWFFGPYGWMIDELVILTSPVKCTGALRLWTLKPDVLAELRESYRSAISGNKEAA